MEELPEEFDLIVIGTGFPESCVAAAASRVGKTVLHVDPNEFYGGAWASFGLHGLAAVLEGVGGRGARGTDVRNGRIQWFEANPLNAEAGAEAAAETWTREKLLEESRRFNLDLCPKILYSAGELVQLLISSNICRYAEFRAVDRVCTQFDGRILNVPCSRSDVFNTKDLGIVEKRLLMKFLNACMTYHDDKSEEDSLTYRGRTFREYLQAQKVTPKISSCVMNAIAMCDEETPFEEGMARVQRFLSSLGRYGNTPFLFPMYGNGEIPQCFCRLCAVFGGIYCLKRRIEAITTDADTNSVTVVIENKAIRAKHVVCAPGNMPANILQSGIGILGLGPLKNFLSRGIFIAATPLGDAELNAGGGGVNLLRLTAAGREAILIQLSHYSGTCPKGVYVFHLTTPAVSDNPEEDLRPFTGQVFSEAEHSPRVLCAAYFSLTACGAAERAVDTSTPVFCTAAPFYELDYDLSIRNAREIFARMYPDVEFLPRAPDPEEIVIEGEDPRALSEHNLPEDLREQLRELERSVDEMEIEEESTKGDQQMEETD